LLRLRGAGFPLSGAGRWQQGMPQWQTAPTFMPQQQRLDTGLEQCEELLSAEDEPQKHGSPTAIPMAISVTTSNRIVRRRYVTALTSIFLSTLKRVTQQSILGNNSRSGKSNHREFQTLRRKMYRVHPNTTERAANRTITSQLAIDLT
jgi:hypothetical protein